jgi:signal transduction histidine kinase
VIPTSAIPYQDLLSQLANLRLELEEANETIEAIRTGQVDALVVRGANGHQLYTLKSADQSYRVFIEKMNEGAVTLNKGGVILYCNSQFSVLVNCEISKIIGTPFEQFISLGYKNQFKLLMERGWKEDCKGEIVLKAKKYPTVQLSLTTLEMDDGTSLSVIVTDLTIQKEAQRNLKLKNDELERINRELEVSNNDLLQFASVASHDLQEPLRKIEVFSNILIEKEKEKLSEEAQNYLMKIRGSSARMKQLIIDVLDYSRLSANDSNYELVDLKEVVNDWMVDYEMAIREKRAKIHIAALPVIEVNRGQMRQVFQNILSNALKFSKNGQRPVVTIDSTRIKDKKVDSQVSSMGKYCRISIKDNGIGFDQKYVANVFSLFERLHTKDKYEGTGIGLAVAKKIIEKHNGLITAKSVEGDGAEFIIILPVSR